MVESEGLANRAHFLGFRDDVPALMKGVDIVAHTSIAPEPFGRVVVEGMLAGKPVIAARDGGVTEIIDDGRDGLLVPSGDANALAAAIRQLADRTFAWNSQRAGHASGREQGFDCRMCRRDRVGDHRRIDSRSEDFLMRNI